MLVCALDVCTCTSCLTTFSSQIFFYNKETCSNIKSYTTIIVLNMSGALNEKS